MWQYGQMENINRRDFMKRVGISTAGASLLGTSTLLTACSNDSESGTDTSTDETSVNIAAAIISSDLHNSETSQRLAFSIFDSNKQIIARKPTSVVLVAPSKKEQVFKDVALRDKGIKDKGIYSVNAILNETGPWLVKTKHQSKPLELNVSVAQDNIAPFEGDICPSSPTPTNSNPLDAKILCTKFEGDCGLHSNSTDQLLASGKPFVVLFATPARCQTAYCGPVLDLTLEEAKKFDIDIVHVEIYKDDVSNAVLDAVTAWNIPSEPWMFGVTKEGKISKRLDGAFDQTEIAELIQELI